MKKILSLVLVLVLMMSVAVVASATDTSLPIAGESSGDFNNELNNAFMAISDFLKLDAFAPYIDGFHEAFLEFYIQLDVWLRAISVFVYSFIGNILAGQ